MRMAQSLSLLVSSLIRSLDIADHVPETECASVEGTLAEVNHEAAEADKDANEATKKSTMNRKAAHMAAQAIRQRHAPITSIHSDK